MKKVKEAWDDIYQISTMSAQTLRDNAAKFCKYNSSLYKNYKIYKNKQRQYI